MKNGMVLIYHRVSALSHDPHRIAVHPARFEAQINYLKENYTILSLRELVERIKASSPVENCAAVTFDDGYADNLHEAKPILEKFQVPAAVFVTAGMIGSSREFWWDELERIFLAGGEPSGRIKLEINHRQYSWKIEPGETFMKVYPKVHRLLKYLPGHEREKILDDLFTWRKLDRDAGRQTHRVLDEPELLELARGGLVEIGSHSLTHPALIVEPEERQWSEIHNSGVILASLLKEKIYGFSYPFGQRLDIDEKTIRMVKEAGYSCGISNIQGNIDEKTDPYLVPRRIIRDWDLTEFQQKIAEFSTLAGPTPPFKYSPICSPGAAAKIKNYLNHIKRCERNIQPQNRKRKTREILFINYFDQKGGAAKVCYRLFDFLCKKNLDVNLLVRKKFSTHEKIREIASEVPADNEDQEFLTRFQEREGWLDIFHYSSFLLKQSTLFQKADVVHLHNLQINYFSLAALPEMTCLKPVIWTIHDMYAITGHCINSYGCPRWENGCGECPDLNIEVPVTKDTTALLWQLKKIIYQYADIAVVSPSQWLKLKLEKSLIKNKEIKLIYNGVDETVFKNHNKRKARKLLQLPGDKKILLFAAPGGNSQITKGRHFIQSIMERLGKRNILAICIGGPGIDIGNTSTLPYIEDEKQLAFYYSAADLFIYPSLADNCPLVVLEALSCGTPVISFNTGGIPELVKHKETGYIARYKDITDLTGGIEFYLDNPALLEKASRQARRSVLKQFTLETMVKKYLELYEARYREFCTTPHSIDESYKAKLEKLLAGE
jgi:glycosyltransferase involved in cell wall biosynthesis/peptidoglycan/xylan/chitin deacetylase (PgdA/CDA1 family)